MTPDRQRAALDARVQRGMSRQLERRSEHIAAGATPVGWKIGFGAPAAMRALSISRPLVGYLMKDGLIAPDESVSVADWTQAVLEPEIAVHIGRTLRRGGEADEVAAAISGLGPAIELADLDGPADDVEKILSGNIFHRRAALGAIDFSRAGGLTAGLRGRLVVDGGDVTWVDDVEANTGLLLEIVSGLADTLAEFGLALGPGDVIIAGSVVPPVMLDGSEREVRFDLVESGAVSVKFPQRETAGGPNRAP